MTSNVKLLVIRNMKEPMLLQIALKTSTERASNLCIIVEENIVRAPHTRNVTLLSSANYASFSCKSDSMTSKAEDKTPLSIFVKKCDARNVMKII